MFKKDECIVVSVDVINAAKAREETEKHKVVYLAKTQQRIMNNIRESVENGNYFIELTIRKSFLDTIQSWLEQLGYKVTIMEKIIPNDRSWLFVTWKEEQIMFKDFWIASAVLLGVLRSSNTSEYRDVFYFRLFHTFGRTYSSNWRWMCLLLFYGFRDTLSYGQGCGWIQEEKIRSLKR